jgi:lysozyme
MIRSARDLIRLHEGLTLVAKPDAHGKWEIGFGHDGAVEGQTCTEEEAEALFEEDFAIAEAHAVSDVGPSGWSAVDEVRQAVIIDMSYELGGDGLLGFHKLLAAVRAHDWPDAAEQLVNSKLYREVPGREKMNAAILLSGNWPAD